MVYMAADDSAELDAHAVRDLKEIEKNLPGSGVDVLVQINRFWPKQPQRYELVGGQLVLAGEHAKGNSPSGQEQTAAAPAVATPVESTVDKAGADRVSANMGAAETFGEFLDWAAEILRARTWATVLPRALGTCLWPRVRS